MGFGFNESVAGLIGAETPTDCFKRSMDVGVMARQIIHEIKQANAERWLEAAIA